MTRKTTKTKNGITTIYVRRSVSDKDKSNNSLSINAQKEECVKFVGENSAYRIYCNDGKSGKDIQHRPAFIVIPKNQYLKGNIFIKPLINLHR